MTIVVAALASTNQPPDLVFFIAFLIGALLFFLGFRTYREYRVLAETPETPVRSIPMGLVRVRGTATGDDRLTSPLTGVPCFYYHVRVDKWVKKENENGKWEKVSTETDERPFYLDDGTGKVLVMPHGAQYEVLRTFQGEIGMESVHARYVDPSLGILGPTEQDLAVYVKGGGSRAGAAMEATDAPGAKTVGKIVGVAQEIGSLGIALSEGGLTMDFGLGQSYRFTERCLLADRECNIIGTCVENPNPKDEHDRNLLKKGQNEKTFLITSMGEKQVEESLRLRAIIMALAGAAIMIGVVALALHKARMLYLRPPLRRLAKGRRSTTGELDRQERAQTSTFEQNLLASRKITI